LTKPFKFEELLARIRARLRSGAGSETTALEVGGVRLDLRTRRASSDGRSITLTAREFTMLETLMRHAGQVLSREQLLSHVWGYDYDPGSNVVDVCVGYLRKEAGRRRDPDRARDGVCDRLRPGSCRDDLSSVSVSTAVVRGLRVTVRAEKGDVLETVVHPVSVHVVEGHAQRVALPFGDPAPLTAILLQSGADESRL
jgi:Transcriptional regulatory protein, C terminal